jgi:hypothetical protein
MKYLFTILALSLISTTLCFAQNTDIDEYNVDVSRKFDFDVTSIITSIVKVKFKPAKDSKTSNYYYHIIQN